jgi:serine/threonine-protein kinase
VAAFHIGRTEVTNTQYAQCVAAEACTAPGTYDRCNYSNAAYAEHPVVCITREQAREYAVWVGGSLPTEAQWTRACQGDDGRAYPWGEAPPDEWLANFNHRGRRNLDTTAVGRYPAVANYLAGASPYGALGMAGNVWEWVDDGDFVVRGGAFHNYAGSVACDARVDFVDGSYGVGIRVVSPAP